ncbi:exodeoxyribonuclease V subunit gamma [Stenotrophomonas panacihumi]|uniref:RecBCD enzyme subunit RecC n=1 Tax=Stenotrophomonas panacihumi TaxID=676599 RepID=A0A0Q9ZYB4_9GAMM|nr:exodeoxyribonuclease V subunit gamma [Stenotrophomonas panacihumi]KRG37887.1 exodeoxyribonuclease V subunit gamma [Stenotrophomonas panacihumi]PTN56060.1 exodeoxyribonuclease V subunit gamma [Stenotrophomonas panacihumi]
MTPAVPDFRLYHSNSLEVLAGLLAEELRQPAPGQSLLVPDLVLIPQVAMRRWLQASLAAEHGVAANLEFLTPGEFVSRALAANVGGGADDLDAAALRWHLYAALGEPRLMARPPLRALSDYLADGDPLKAWALAGELGDVFEKYQAWRRDWLLRWEAGADAEDPQAILWRRVAEGRPYRARRIHDYLVRFGEDRAALPQGLPPRLFAFATLNISPDVLRVLATQARVGTLHFYMPSPTRSYWGDLQTRGEQRRAGEDATGADNRLLQAWGAAGRDFMAVLGSYEVVHPSGDFPAYADPEADARGEPSLLRGLQGDLFHRRAAPGLPPRAEVDRHDPSVQVHACHTRLRELQVLHDQLRALLDDARFDPPLQPREIAVLAPDIDPYLPYLDAVFGARGRDEAVPYALADASPLAGEPLADVFVRLLGLPLSRFGLAEVFDLLASPPVAEAAGLDAAALDRLHEWLQAAGARWGLDAAHRQQHDAPREDAYTWAFALDRLLLGHASGAEDTIAGVAPWPELEGGALAALDTLVRLLRILARQQQALAEALTPAQWRERLLALLDALLPQAPATPAGERALDRLRNLIDTFAADAARAGFDAPVAAEVVRAHFAATLAEADTRAPLLTGGVSIGRMVPMRLLPFRVICLLGMNDGDYPRRDPAAGLNRLTAELGSERRRPGDRSLREDDRFLFLQLFASAQDVFYLSYLGADPRDGSPREPSVLVSELLGAAAACHADPAQAARALVVQQPLQPFAPAAFGDATEPRRFSYRAQWQPAAAALGNARGALDAWAAGMLPPFEAEDDLPLESLRRFLTSPSEQFLRQRLGLRLPDAADTAPDIEPLVLPGGRDGQVLRQVVLDALLAGADIAQLPAALRARALLPAGPAGEQQLRALTRTLAPLAQAFNDWRGHAEAQSQRYEVDIDGVRLHGRVGGLYVPGMARLRAGALNGPAVIAHGLDWLLASAADDPRPLLRFTEEGGGPPEPLPPPSPSEARARLSELLHLRSAGLRAPLPFGAYSGWEFFNADGDAHVRRRKAAERWQGNDRQWGEGNGDAPRLALRGRDPFADDAAFAEFARISDTVFAAVTGRAPAEVA